MEEKSLTNIKPFIDKLKELYQYQLKNDGINSTGNLSNFTYDVEWGDANFRVYFLLEEYWKWVEYGRRAGKQPPIQQIIDWIQVKPIVPKARNGKVPTTKQLAFAISKSIGENGTKPKKPLSKALSSPEATNIINNIKTTLITQINNEIKDVIQHAFK